MENFKLNKVVVALLGANACLFPALALSQTNDRRQSILHTRALIMGRYGMLRCANNFSNGCGTKKCRECDVIDDEKNQ